MNALLFLPLYLFSVFFPLEQRDSSANPQTPAAEKTVIRVTPANPVLDGDPISVSISGLLPGKDVLVIGERVVRSQFLGGKTVLFQSRARFSVGESGRIELGTAVPRDGSYSGADPRGLFWSMVPTDAPLPADLKPGQVRFRVEPDGGQKAEVLIEFVQSLPDIVTEEVKEFPGAFFSYPKGKTGLPTVIVLGGAEGGSRSVRGEGPKFASRGFAVLVLPYYSPPKPPLGEREIKELPADFKEIPIDRLELARNWLAGRKEADAGRIALYGASKGAEFALLAASHFEWIKAVVAVAPSDVIWEGWGLTIPEGTCSSFSFKGKPFPFVPYVGFGAEQGRHFKGLPVFLRRPHDRGRAANPKAAVEARIPIERFRGKLMLIAGQDDQLWNSAMMAHNIAERRAGAGLSTDSLIYSDAGHILTGTGWAPTTHYNAGLVQNGGTPAGNAAAQGEAWPKMLAFLRGALGEK
jgi:dienelactone hydrolase